MGSSVTLTQPHCSHPLKNLGRLRHLVAESEAERAETRALLQESVATFQEINDRWGLASALSQLAQVNYTLGDYSAARQQLQDTLQIAHKNQFSPILLAALVDLVALRQQTEPSSSSPPKGGLLDLELLQLVLAHPASRQATRTRAMRLRAEFETDLSGSTTDTVPERERSRTLETIVAQILSEQTPSSESDQPPH